ncbi:MFS transporter [Nocardioides anomalus]|uniref:MFS transporter n=1 Tax=Nocardioides anomalus TaxID=2712223 RepID=A0A6G6WIA8_9ACTN|nr:MFS transporter [Nocardioides anomalus]QIG44974.1 MFS transporter [Nocardioides anomalus]
MVPRRAIENRETDARIDVVGALLLGLAVLCLLYPVVRVESGARLPLVLLVGVPLFALAFVRWEHRLVRREHPPLLDLTLLRGLPGYVNGLLVSTLYFTGYTGLVHVVYLQEGLGYSALRTGLLLMPFAVRSAR